MKIQAVQEVIDAGLGPKKVQKEQFLVSFGKNLLFQKYPA